jgi:hypothetical protein
MLKKVNPSDTIWMVKWKKIHSESQRRPSEALLPPPDDQRLLLPKS